MKDAKSTVVGPWHTIGVVCGQVLLNGGPPPWMVGADEVPHDSFGVCGRVRKRPRGRKVRR